MGTRGVSTNIKLDYSEYAFREILKNEEERRKHKKQFDIIEEAKIQDCEITNNKN